MTTREVVLDGGSPWGFRLHGGADVNQPLRISRVNPGSKAALRGIREGDFITSINNRSTKDISNAEAHALLRNSGDTLKLGLNEDTNGSPKRRQYKTVHQETHSETVKKSSITSYTVTSSSKTVSQTELNDQKTSKVNGNSNVNGGSTETKAPAVSQRSTLSSCSSSSSTYTSSPTGIDMADNARSRRKRARNNRKRGKQIVNTTEVIVEETPESCVSPPINSEYRVESPKRIKSPEAKKPIKSRSLDDDDDLIKIQELSEVSESEDKFECKAIVSEAESDLEWETASTMDAPQTLSLALEPLVTTEQTTFISPEEELTLRNFLETLNLINSPEDAFLQVSTMESVKSRRAKKRQVLEHYFTPIMQNPRFLDVISEETSDLSDREQSLTHHLKQGTPEPEVPPRRRSVENKAILVGTKMIGTHEICSTSVPEDRAEVVFLEDSSNSTTPDPKSDVEEEKDTNEILSSCNSSVPDLRESESVEDAKEVVVRMTGEGDVICELTPPPTPVDIGPENDIGSGETKENNLDEDKSQEVLDPQPEEITKPNETKELIEETPKERIVNIAIENEGESAQVASKRNQTVQPPNEVVKNIEIVRTQNFQSSPSSPKIIKLDDLTPPVVLTPTDNTKPSFGSFIFNTPNNNVKSKERNVEIVRSEEVSTSPKDHSVGLASKTSYEKFFAKTRNETVEPDKSKEVNIEINRSKEAPSVGLASKTSYEQFFAKTRDETDKTNKRREVNIEIKRSEEVDPPPKDEKAHSVGSASKTSYEKFFAKTRHETDDKRKDMNVEIKRTEDMSTPPKVNKHQDSVNITDKEETCNLKSVPIYENVKSDMYSKIYSSFRNPTIFKSVPNKPGHVSEEKTSSCKIPRFDSLSDDKTEKTSTVEFFKKYIPTNAESENVFTSTAKLQFEPHKPNTKVSDSRVKYIPIKMESAQESSNQMDTTTQSLSESQDKVQPQTSQPSTRYVPIKLESDSKEQLLPKPVDVPIELESETKILSSNQVEASTRYIPIQLEAGNKISNQKKLPDDQRNSQPSNQVEASTRYISIQLEAENKISNQKKLPDDQGNSQPTTVHIPIQLESEKEISDDKVSPKSQPETRSSKIVRLETESKISDVKICERKEISTSPRRPDPPARYIPSTESQLGNVKCIRNVPIELESESGKILKNQVPEPPVRHIPIKLESNDEKVQESTAPSRPPDPPASYIPTKLHEIQEESSETVKSIITDLKDLNSKIKCIPIVLERPKAEPAIEQIQRPLPAKVTYVPITIETDSFTAEAPKPPPRRRKTGKPEPPEPPKTVESPSKEVEIICSKARPAESIIYSNVLSPPAPSPSPSLSSGSSRATSLCTAKYNSIHSSIADLCSIKDEDLKSKAEYPPSLRELCVNFLMAQPFGAVVLQELADVSSGIEAMTQKLLSAADSSKDDVGVADMKRTEWVGLASDSDPTVLVCLSPTQRTQLDKSKKTGEEADKLLDLHSKFINRTSYHDSVERQVKNEVEISAIKPDCNRLLAIIRDAQEPKNFSTLPRNMNAESARLKAKDLTEWLQLARNKSRSEMNLSENSQRNAQRRKSLPQEFYEQQMLYIQEKEREIQRELEVLEEEKKKLAMEMSPGRFQLEDYHISKKGDFAENKKSRPLSMPVSTEFFRQQMYEEYMDQIAAREERKHLKVIKVSQVDSAQTAKKATGIQHEFMDKVKQKQKLGKLNKDEESGEEESQAVPKHLQEFLEIAKAGEDLGVWSPGQKQELQKLKEQEQRSEARDEPISPVWTPKSATSSPTVERKEFRPVKFESPVLSRKNLSQSENLDFNETSSKEPPWAAPETSSDTGITLSSTLEKRLPTSHSSPGFSDFPTPRLPRAQNPTITLLQKAREGQLPKGALYIEQEQTFKRPQNDKPPRVGPGEVLYKIKNEYTSESDSEKPRKMADLGPRKFEGIGPTTRDGMPLILRSEVKDANQSKWYKRMYDTIHKQKPHRDEYVTVRYKQRRGQYPYTSGYLSEPEPGAYDSDFAEYKYATLDRRRPNKDKENDYVVSSTMPRNVPEKVGSSVIRHGHDPYKNQPGRIENYIPGHSSISEKEAKEWWDEVMDIFDGHLEQQKRVPQTKSFINQALKESGYESDSTLVFRRRDDTAQQLSPFEQKEAYKTVQKGGDIPLYGFRKPAPERPKESPRKYVENEVTIHYKTPVRHEIKEYLSEDELAYRQAEAMKKIYQEERRRKYLQELQDMNNRRHTDNFIPSQKSPIPLNRYDDLDDIAPPVKPRPRSPEPRLMARALYNFVGQTARELTFRKGDLIYVRRQVDKNWYEGELNAMVGLFPVNYVEIVTYDTAKPTPRKSHEGQARAKYNFVAQTHLELSLAKGEHVIVTRRVDDNWFEGKIGGRKGIFPVSYVDLLIDPSEPPAPSGKPVASPAAHSLLLNGSAGGKESMGSHSYTPTLSGNQLTSSYHAKPAQATGYGSVNRKNPVSQALHIETQAEPIPYRALYKYLPQNDDELELLEGDTVYVLEKCDDGWYVGSSERTGAFGTFPGNYVEKI